MHLKIIMLSKRQQGELQSSSPLKKEKSYWQHIFLWHPQFSTMVNLTMVRYLWYKVWMCSVENLPGDRFKALANLSGKLHRKTRLAVSVLQISKTVSNINARLSLWLLERCYCLMKPSTSPCSSSSFIPSSLHLEIICLSCLAFVKDFFEFLKESSPCVSRKAGWTRSIRK